MSRFSELLRIWLLALVVCAAASAISFAYADVPIARHFWSASHFLHPLGTTFGAPVILALEAAVALSLILTRVVRGHISRFGEALAIACLASICTYGVNDEVLKPVFGIPSPIDVMAGAGHALNLLMGSDSSSFPSGHMTLAGAFSGVLMRLYRISIWPLSMLLALAAGLLVVGDWHFLSDVIAGAFVGVSAGMLAGEAWAVHTRRRE